jgi:MFS family permease
MMVAVGVLAVTIAIQALQSLAVLVVPILMPAAAADIGVSAHFAGNFTAVVYASGMAGALMLASAIATRGALSLCIACMLISAAGLAVTGAGHLVFLGLGAIALGFGYGPITPASSDILARRIPPAWYGLVFSVKQTGVPIGFALAGILVPLLVVNAGWQAATVVLAAVLAVAALALLPLRAALNGERRPPAGGGLRAMFAPLGIVMRHRQLRLLSVGSIAYLVPQSCLGTFLVVFLVDRLGLSLTAAGLALSITQGVGMVARVVWGAIADRMAERMSLLGLLGVITAVGAVMVMAADGTWSYALVVVACCIYGAGAIGWNGVMLAELARWAPPGQTGAVTGAATAITFLGAVLGPAGFGLLRGLSGGYDLGFGLLAAGAAVAGVALTWEGWRLRRLKTTGKPLPR